MTLLRAMIKNWISEFCLFLVNFVAPSIRWINFAPNPPAVSYPSRFFLLSSPLLFLFLLLLSITSSISFFLFFRKIPYIWMDYVRSCWRNYVTIFSIPKNCCFHNYETRLNLKELEKSRSGKISFLMNKNFSKMYRISISFDFLLLLIVIGN